MRAVRSKIHRKEANFRRLDSCPVFPLSKGFSLKFDTGPRAAYFLNINAY